MGWRLDTIVYKLAAMYRRIPPEPEPFSVPDIENMQGATLDAVAPLTMQAINR
jgi:hypothetical protein